MPSCTVPSASLRLPPPTPAPSPLHILPFGCVILPELWSSPVDSDTIHIKPTRKHQNHKTTLVIANDSVCGPEVYHALCSRGPSPGTSLRLPLPLADTPAPGWCNPPSVSGRTQVGSRRSQPHALRTNPGGVFSQSRAVLPAAPSHRGLFKLTAQLTESAGPRSR